jgi:phosphatidylserine/phosphatidylglycerophosphate/cardiolipin synthase-like enzyme
MRTAKEIPAAILQAIYDARKSIFILTLIFCYRDEIEALQIAATRGVDVRLMMSNDRICFLCKWLRILRQANVGVGYKSLFLQEGIFAFETDVIR